jgi:DNA-binding transcriptional regulator LsrR (DeoR family)
MTKTSIAHAPKNNSDRTSGRVARNRMRIAWMYYVEGLTQNEIADKLGIGRVTVVRNINEATRLREVKVWLEGEIADCTALEHELKQALKLDDAVVVPEPSKPDALAKSIGVAAGMYVSEQLHDNMVIGVGWGGTLYESLQTLSPRSFSGLEVVSLLGGVVEARRYNPAEFAWQFANTVGADSYLLTAPAIVDSAETKRALIERCGLSTVIAHAEKMDVALLSVGGMEAHSTSFRFGFINEQDRAGLKAKGAVGDLLFNFFDENGTLVDHPINQRVMSIPLDSIRRASRRIIASGGGEKVKALIGGMKLVNCNVLITDESTARGLLAAQKANI